MRGGFRFIFRAADGAVWLRVHPRLVEALLGLAVAVPIGLLSLTIH